MSQLVVQLADRLVPDALLHPSSVGWLSLEGNPQKHWLPLQTALSHVSTSTLPMQDQVILKQLSWAMRLLLIPMSTTTITTTTTTKTTDTNIDMSMLLDGRMGRLLLGWFQRAERMAAQAGMDTLKQQAIWKHAYVVMYHGWLARAVTTSINVGDWFRTGQIDHYLELMRCLGCSPTLGTKEQKLVTQWVGHVIPCQHALHPSNRLQRLMCSSDTWGWHHFRSILSKPYEPSIMSNDNPSSHTARPLPLLPAVSKSSASVLPQPPNCGTLTLKPIEETTTSVSKVMMTTTTTTHRRTTHAIRSHHAKRSRSPPPSPSSPVLVVSSEEDDAKDNLDPASKRRRLFDANNTSKQQEDDDSPVEWLQSGLPRYAKSSSSFVQPSLPSSSSSVQPSLPFSPSVQPSLPFSSSVQPSLPFSSSDQPSLPFSSSVQPSLPFSSSSVQPSLPSSSSSDQPSLPSSSSIQPSLPSSSSSSACTSPTRPHTISQLIPVDDRKDGWSGPVGKWFASAFVHANDPNADRDIGHAKQQIDLTRHIDAIDHCLDVATHTPWFQWASIPELLKNLSLPPLLRCAAFRFRFIDWLEQLILPPPSTSSGHELPEISISMIQYLLRVLVYTVWSTDVCDRDLYQRCHHLLTQIVTEKTVRARVLSDVDSYGHLAHLLVWIFVLYYRHRNQTDQLSFTTRLSFAQSLLVIWKWCWCLTLIPSVGYLLERTTQATSTEKPPTSPLSSLLVAHSSLSEAVATLSTLRGKQTKIQKVLIHTLQRWLFHENVRSVLLTAVRHMIKEIPWTCAEDLVWWKDMQRLIGLVPKVLKSYVKPRARIIRYHSETATLQVDWDFPFSKTVYSQSYEMEQDQAQCFLEHERKQLHWGTVLQGAMDRLVDHETESNLLRKQLARAQSHISGLERLLSLPHTAVSVTLTSS